MRSRFFLTAGHLLLAGILVFQPAKADVAANQETAATAHDPTDADIAEIEADMLQTWHYSQHPFDQEIAGKFLDRYLDTLDYSHIYFLQSDIDEFELYRTNLNVLTVKDHDMSPCWVIFSRFMERVKERNNFVTNALASEKFTFDGHDRFVVNRHTLPYAKDLNEAKEFWRQELRANYLQELLTAEDIRFAQNVTNGANGKDEMLFTAATTHISGFAPKAHLSFPAQAPDAEEKVLRVESSRLSSRELSFNVLPPKLLGAHGRVLGSVEVSPNGSNAVVHLEWSEGVDLTKESNALFSADGKKIGDLHFRRFKTMPETNEAAAGPKTNYEGVLHLDDKNIAGIYKSLTNHYGQLWDNYRKLDNDHVFEMYMTSLAHAYDPHSDYMGHMQAENFAITMKLSLFGIGALLQADGDYCKIAELKEGPARKSGKIKENDRIVAVAQSNAEPVDVVGMPLDKIVDKIRGPKGTQVTLTIIPVDAPDSVRKQVTLIRDEIKLEDQAAKARLYDEPVTKGSPLKLGVIDLSSFYADNDHPNVNTTSDVAKLITRLEKEHVDGIILDLRRNGGGYLEEAIKLTGLFIPSGPVVQTKDPNGDIVTDSSPEATPLYDGPLIVLTSVFSASASEILAGALQDYGRALMVGDHSTFGKGTVQTMQRLAPYLDQKHLAYSYDPGSLKVTIKKFYRAGGLSTQLQGVISDIELPSIFTAADVGERSYPNALPGDSVPSADFQPLNRVKPYLAELQSLSRQRVDHDKDFIYMRQDIEEYRKQQADKSISLNEAERLQEQKKNTAQADARRKERLSRKKSGEKAYEITLKNVDLPELEPVPAKTNSVVAVKESGFEDELDSSESETAKEEPAAVDPAMEETKRILTDYIALLKKGPTTARVSIAP